MTRGRQHWVAMLVSSLVLVGVADSVDGALRGRGQARASINRATTANVQRPARANVAHDSARIQSQHVQQHGGGNRVGNRTQVDNRHGNTINIDNHRDVDIDVDGRGHYGYDDHYHPIATAAAVTATVAVTAAVVGAIVTPAQMPASCVQVVRYDATYLQCGATWYQPQYQGSSVTYVVVNAP